MTRTIQTLSRSSIENAETIGKTEEDGNIRDNIHELLSLCDSLNNLYEKLCRLEYVITRKNIELSLTRKQGD